MLEQFKIGNYTDLAGGTGVTAIIAEKGAIGGVSVRGAAPATRETDLLKPDKTVECIHAVVLAGGSAYGLEASCGVMKYLAEKRIGFPVNDNVIPIVCSACIYDLEYRKFTCPDSEAGYKAAKMAVTDNFASGAIGGGTGATVGKLCGMKFAAKAGLGVEKYEMNGIEVAVVVVVNALGDIVEDGKIIAGMMGEDGRYMDSLKVFLAGGFSPFMTNTTVGCVLTNAKLTKVEANIIADLAHDGIAQAVSPSHTMFDGDAMFCMASGEKAVEFNTLTALIPRLTKKAIINAMKVPKENIQEKVTEVKLAALNNYKRHKV